MQVCHQGAGPVQGQREGCRGPFRRQDDCKSGRRIPPLLMGLELSLHALHTQQLHDSALLVLQPTGG